MQKWGYWLAEFRAAQGDWRIRSENHQVNAEYRKAPTMFDYLNEHGAHGWELVAAVRSSDDKEWSLFFKKPIS